MKIVVLDGFTLNPGDLSWDELAVLGELTVYDRTPEDEILNRIQDASVIFTNKTPISKETMQACKELRYIGVLATGYNVVDIEAAKDAGLIVSNIPTYGTNAVAQYAIALLLELCHHVGEHSRSVMAGEWSQNADWCYWNYPLTELAGKTMGIIGYGRIGQKTGLIAEALGMKVIAYDANPNRAYLCGSCQYAELLELFAEADVISLHCPLTPETEGIINRENLAKMKNGVMIINDSRGPLVVEKDLAEALICGKVAGAAVDVVSTEPIQEDNPLLTAPNLIITPHMAWAPKESRQRLMDIAVANFRKFLEGESVNVVNQ